MSLPLLSQNIDKGQLDDFVYQREWRIGVKIHTNGYGISMAKTKILNRWKKNSMELELMEIKHPKQTRQLGKVNGTSTSLNPSSYFYGKQNNLYSLSYSYGRHRILAEKGRKNGVEIGIHYSLGFSLGIIKPYMLNIRLQDNTFADVAYTANDEENNEDIFLEETRIFGASGFLVGWNKLAVTPGVIAKFGLVFDWAGLSETIKAFELGAMVNAYPRRVPIMILEKNNIVYTNLYLKLIFGRRFID